MSESEALFWYVFYQPIVNCSSISQYGLIDLKIDWVLEFLFREYAYQIWLTCNLYFLRKSGEIVFDRATLITVKGQIYACQKNFPTLIEDNCQIEKFCCNFNFY